jgi:hypothetical protein
VIRFISDPPLRDLRLFGGLWTPILLLVLAWIGGRGGWPPAATGLVVGAAAAISLVGWLRPGWVRPLWLVLMAVAFPIGFVVSHLLLTLVWLLVFTPIALGLRLAGKDPLRLRRDPAATSYWVDHEQTEDVGRYFRLF